MNKFLTITDIKKGLIEKQFSSLEITEYYLQQIEQHKKLNTYISVNQEKAIEAARDADLRLQKGEKHPLLGVPISIKDIYCTQNIRTTAGSKMLENFVPQYESTVTQNLLDSGAIFLGKTNMDEFAMGSSNTTSFFGNCYSPYRNCFNPDIPISPGGSSGGSAAAVAADLCAASIGSDTGGSVRQPASFCGLVGIKPTYGLCSRYGMIAFASSFDQAGPITKTVEDAAIMLSIMAGYDEKDSTSLNVAIPDYTKFLGKSIKGMKIGLAHEHFSLAQPWCMDIIETTKKWLKDAGCEIVDISLPTTSYSLPVYYIIAPAEASSNLARFDGVRYGYRHDKVDNINDFYIKSRSEGFGDEVKRRILNGTYVLSAGHYDAYYTKALKIQQMIKDDFKNNAFANVDLVLTLTTPNTAFSIEESKNMSAIEMYLSDIFTVTANVAGLPAISVPGALAENGLPVSVQLISDKLQERKIFQVASVLEKYANFDKLRKKIVSII